MKDFAELICYAQKDNESALIELLDAFEPLINKYVRLMNYDEDFKQELVLKFIQIIKSELNLNKMRNINNFVIVKYIENSMYHHYIHLSKKKRAISITEVESEDEFIINISDANRSELDKPSEILLMNMLESVLTEREFLCVKMIVLQGYTAEEVAYALNITKQAVNQCKLRAFKKLQQFYS